MADTLAQSSTLKRTNIVTAVGVVFLLIGLLGLFNDPVLGIFEVDMMHNIVHLVSGAAALLYGMRSEENAVTYARIFGVIYLLVTIIGFLAGTGNILGMEMNTADDFLHLFLTVVLLWVGFS
jgi:hypothetical protein